MKLLLAIGAIQSTIFKNVSLRARILTVSALVSCLVCLLSAYFAVKGYQLEKQAHLFETHALRTAAASERVRAFLISLPGFSADAAEVEGSFWSSDVFLRRPQRGEVFAASQGKKQSPLIVWESKEGVFLKKNLDVRIFEKTMKDMTDTPFCIVDSDGIELISSSISKKRVQILLAMARQSGLADFQSTFAENGEKYIFSFNEIQNTNLSLLTLHRLGDFLLPLRRALIIWAAICVLVLTIGMVAQYFLLSLVVQPLRELVQFFKSITLGKSPAPVASALKELAPVFEGAAVMQGAIASREKRLMYFAKGLERILQQSREQSEIGDEKKIVLEFFLTFSSLLKNATLFRPLFYDVLEGKEFVLKDLTAQMQSQAQEDIWQESSVSALKKLFSSLEEHLGFDGLKQTEFKFLMVDDDFARQEADLFKSAIVGAESLKRVEKFKNGIFCVKIFALEEEWGSFLVPFCMQVPFQEYMEFGELLKLAIDSLQSTLVKQRMTELKISDELVKKEIGFAQKIHERCLDVNQVMPKQVEISTIFRPANKVGGDWLGVYFHKELNLVHFYIGDVSGHGLDSAFLVSLISGAIKMSEREFEREGLRLQGGISGLASIYLSRMCSHLNALLKAASSTRFMTMALGILDANTGDLYFANAGHVPPLKFKHNGDFAGSIVVTPSDPLGAWSESAPQVCIHKERLNAGETILLFTDGLPENMGTTQGLLRNKRGLNAIGCLLKAQPSQFPNFAADVLNWGTTHAQEWEMKDDVAILALKYVGEPATATPLLNF